MTDVLVHIPINLAGTIAIALACSLITRIFFKHWISWRNMLEMVIGTTLIAALRDTFSMWWSANASLLVALGLFTVVYFPLKAWYDRRKTADAEATA